MPVEICLCGVPEGALVFREAAILLNNGVGHGDGPVSGYNPQGNILQTPVDHVAVEILPDVDISSAGGEQRWKLSRDCKWCSQCCDHYPSLLLSPTHQQPNPPQAVADNTPFTRDNHVRAKPVFTQPPSPSIF